MIRRTAPWVLFCAATALLTAQPQQYTISTVAGSGPAADLPLDPLSLPIGFVNGVTTDSAGNIYFATPGLAAVFKLDTAGTLTRVAGNLLQGYGGDGGPASQAQLFLAQGGYPMPAGLAIDPAGNLYLSDTYNHRVRKVTADGTIVTVAGTGVCGAAGDGGPAAGAQLCSPGGLALDSSGNLYIADTFNSRVRKLSTSGILTTVAGNGSAVGTPAPDGAMALSAEVIKPSGVAVDAAGTLYIACTFANRVYRVTPDGVISTVAQLNYPIDVTVDDSGTLYIAQLYTVQRISPGGDTATVVGYGGFQNLGDGGPATAAGLHNVYALAVAHDGALLLADTGNDRLRKVTADGLIHTVAGNGNYTASLSPGFSGDGTTAATARLNSPGGVALDSAGNLFIADTLNNRIRKVSPDGTISTAAGTGTAGFSGDGQAAVNAQLWAPTGLAVDRAGNLFFIDSANARVRRVSTGGTITTVAGNGRTGSTGDNGPATSASLSQFLSCNQSCGGLAVDRGGNLFIADPDSHRVRKVSTEGIITAVAGTGDFGFSGDGNFAVTAQLGCPTGLATDDAGSIYIADPCFARVRKVSPDDTIDTLAGTGISYSGTSSGDGGPARSAMLSAPAALSLDPAGNLFIADPGSFFYTGDAPELPCCDQRIRKVSPDGTITTVAGIGAPGFSGDGGPAYTARLNGPVGLAADGAGNIYIADSGNNAIRMIHPTGHSSLVAGVVNGASQKAGAVSPGETVLISGSGLGPAQLTTDSNAGAKVLFDGAPATVVYTSAAQVAAVVPAGIASPSVQVMVSYQGQNSNTLAVPVAASAPGLFTLNQSGWGQAAAANCNGSPNSAANPVKAGDCLTLYLTGITDPCLKQAPVNVLIGGIAAPAICSGQPSAQPAGVVPLTLAIPAAVPAGGYVPVVLQSGDTSTQNNVWIAVRN